MVMHHYGSDINQLAIMDVLRTSNITGTQSYDIVRGGHFSIMSATPEQYLVLFPDVAPRHGWDQRVFGYAAFGYRSESDGCYVDHLLPILDAGVPVIVLMAFSETDKGGHYRVTVGYEQVNGEVVLHLLDPWDRSGNERIQKFSKQRFCNLWNYREPVKGAFRSAVAARKQVQYQHMTLANDRETFAPYFAAVIYPWDIKLEHHLDPEAVNSTAHGANIIITASITYTVFKPFYDSKLVAEDTKVRAEVPYYFSSKDNLTLDIGPLAPGETRVVKWKFFVADTNNGALPTTIKVVAFGNIHSSVPDMWYNPQISSKGYQYTDSIGGTASINY